MSAAHLNKENFELYANKCNCGHSPRKCVKKERVLKVTVFCSFEKKTTCRVGMRAQESEIGHILQSWLVILDKFLLQNIAECKYCGLQILTKLNIDPSIF